jgi:hypothetical protein
MQLAFKLCAGEYKLITDPQPGGADYKSAPAARSKGYSEEQWYFERDINK